MNLLATPKAGRRVGRFALIEELGRGAQATVWRAHDERLDRDVALKLIDDRADSVAVAQWLHEARAVGRLAHPNIVPVFEADEAGGQPYLVFELVRGRTLADQLRQAGAMPQPVALKTLDAVLDALAAAHAEGIVHRDLKRDRGRDSNRHCKCCGYGRICHQREWNGRCSAQPDGCGYRCFCHRQR